MNTPLILSYQQVAVASVMILGVWGLSAWLKLGLGKTLLIASVRTVLQLSLIGLIGLILAWVFARSQWYEVLAILTVMTLIASVSASNRVKHAYRGLRLDSLLAIVGSAWSVALVGIVMVFDVHPWYQPSTIIPVMGLILGNSLTAVSLCMSQLVAGFHREQAMIQMQLSLSATPFEASQMLIKSAIYNGITGVPFYILAGKYSVNGAQSPESFAEGLALAWSQQLPSANPLNDKTNQCEGDNCQI